jgi:hypothetical protein
MTNLITYAYSYYYIVLILQGICVFHSVRKGNQAKWIWIILVFSFVGCIVYICTEIIKRRHVNSIQSGVINIVNPSGRIKELEKKFNFSDTFATRTALADAYLESGMHEKAIELYEPALNGLFSNNEHVVNQLILAYYHVKRYADVVRIAPRIENTLNFQKSKANLLYALSLEQVGNLNEAEKQFMNMNHRFSNFEARYNYGEFLLRDKREDHAALIFQDILDEAQHMNRNEKGRSVIWIEKAKVARTRLGQKV